jgi:hypothetical protein
MAVKQYHFCIVSTFQDTEPVVKLDRAQRHPTAIANRTQPTHHQLRDNYATDP